MHRVSYIWYSLEYDTNKIMEGIGENSKFYNFDSSGIAYEYLHMRVPNK